MFAVEPSQIILLAVFLLVGFPVHEFAHAFVANQLGDGTAKLFGRLTLNPVAHFDPLGGVFLVLSVLAGGFIFGWAKPTPVNIANLRDRRNGELAVALAGPASNLIMASLMALVIRVLVALDVSVPPLVADVLLGFVYYNIALAVFNIIPIPPLDGSTILYRFLDPQTAWRVRPVLSQYGLILLLLFVFTLGRPVARLVIDATRFLVGF